MKDYIYKDYIYMYRGRDDKSIPLCFMTMCGILHYTSEKITLESGLVENCGQLYKLSPGMPIAIELDKSSQPGFLDLQYHPITKRLEWTIAGMDIWGREMDGLLARVPLYVKIERDDGETYDLENPGTFNASDYNNGHHFYRYSNMDISQAISMHIDGILKLIDIDEEDRFVFKSYADYLIENARDINMDALRLVRDSCNNAKRNIPRWTPEKGLDVLKGWIEVELKYVLGYPPNQPDTGTMTRPTETSGVPIIKEETPITAMIVPIGMRYTGGERA